jgi:2-phospho-L-lactate guanylyltransferase
MRAQFGVVVPIRTFALANTRLSGALPDDARALLARRLADTVVRAAGDAPVVIVTSAPEVEEWARRNALELAPDPGSLDAAAAAGIGALAGRGALRAVVAHGDLPFATTFHHVTRDADQPVAVLVPDHRDDGTPVLSIPVRAPFTWSYGPGSFRRHLAAARAAGLAVRVVRDPELAFDVDTVDDLREVASRVPELLTTAATRP